MKKNVLKLSALLFCLIMQPIQSQAQSRTINGVTETEQLGIAAGVAMACRVDYDTLANYEMIASRIIANPLKTDTDERVAIKLYSEAKLKAYKEQKKSPKMHCSEILERFKSQEIFKTTVYRDGTLKFSNGKVLKPKRPIKVEKK